MEISLKTISGKIKAAQCMIEDAKHGSRPWLNSTTALALLEYVNEAEETTKKQKEKARDLYREANDIFQAYEIEHKHDCGTHISHNGLDAYVHTVQDAEMFCSDEYSHQCDKIKLDAIIDLVVLREMKSLV